MELATGSRTPPQLTPRVAPDLRGRGESVTIAKPRARTGSLMKARRADLGLPVHHCGSRRVSTISWQIMINLRFWL